MRQGDRLVAIGRLADKLRVGRGLQHHAQPVAEEGVVVGNEDAQAPTSRDGPRVPSPSHPCFSDGWYVSLPTRKVCPFRRPYWSQWRVTKNAPRHLHACLERHVQIHILSGKHAPKGQTRR